MLNRRCECCGCVINGTGNRKLCNYCWVDHNKYERQLWVLKRRIKKMEKDLY